MKKVTFKEISKIVGVSPMHVSRALAGHPYVKEELRRKIAKVAKQLNYSVNPFGRGLSKNIQMKAKMICLLTKYDNFFQTEYFINLMDSISNSARSKGYDIIIASLGNDGPGNIKRLKNLISYYKAGIIEGFVFVAPAMEAEEGLFLHAEKANLVCVGGKLDVEAKYVDVDNFEAGYGVGEYLTGLGHRRIAFVGGFEDRFDTHDRRQGFLNCLRIKGIEPEPELALDGRYDTVGGKRATAKLFSKKARPDAVFYSNDLMAYGGIEYFRERKMAVPDEVSIVGFDDLAASAETDPPLTTLRQPYEEMGKSVVELLFEKGIVSRKIPARMMIRKSCTKR
ncbi:MAG: LacI family DNA-binding transcriptional regulator [Candidatus Omnitrophota bacterium]